MRPSQSSGRVSSSGERVISTRDSAAPRMKSWAAIRRGSIQLAAGMHKAISSIATPAGARAIRASSGIASIAHHSTEIVQPSGSTDGVASSGTGRKA